MAATANTCWEVNWLQICATIYNQIVHIIESIVLQMISQNIDRGNNTVQGESYIVIILQP